MLFQRSWHYLQQPLSVSLRRCVYLNCSGLHVAHFSGTSACSLLKNSPITSATTRISGQLPSTILPIQIHKVRSYNFAASHQGRNKPIVVSGSGSVALSSPMTSQSSSVMTEAIVSVPSYMSSIPTYAFCYLSELGIKLFDNSFVANFILFGQMNRLISKTLEHIEAGENIIQIAHVYGKLANRLMEKIGKNGKLTLIDIAECQVNRAKEKLVHYLPNHPLSNLRVQIGDAQYPPPALRTVLSSSAASSLSYDKSLCFFLLHEVPSHVKYNVVKAQLRSTSSAVIFVDYHRPHKYNPFRPILSAVLDAWEPYAKELWEDDNEIWNYVDFEERSKWEWKKETIFGGFYQIVVAQRKRT